MSRDKRALLLCTLLMVDRMTAAGWLAPGEGVLIYVMDAES